MNEIRRTSSYANILLVGAGLLVAVVLLALFVLPMADCPKCKWNFFGPYQKSEVEKIDSFFRRCDACGDRTRVSLFKRWRLERNK